MASRRTRWEPFVGRYGGGVDDDSLPDGLPVPFSLHVDLLDRMLNFELADDPTYTGIEVQRFDDALHGRGVAVLLMRRQDGRVDVHHEPGLRLDRAGYEIGGGLREWRTTEFDVARFEVTPRGVDLAVAFDDVEGRHIEVRVGDRTWRPRRTAAFLAPMGAEIAEPRSLPLVWMASFDLLRRRGPKPVISIDGRAAAPGRLPAEWLLRRRLIKVATDLCIVYLNEAGDRSTATVGDPALGPDGLAAVTASAGGHDVVLGFDPPFPAGSVRPEASVTGDWHLEIDEMPVVGGTWQAEPAGDGTVGVTVEVTRGWEPTGLPALMAVVTRVVPVFRRWPTTYRWTGTVTPGGEPRVDGRWERTGADLAQSYRSMTGSG